MSPDNYLSLDLKHKTHALFRGQTLHLMIDDYFEPDWLFALFQDIFTKLSCCFPVLSSHLDPDLPKPQVIFISVLISKQESVL